MVVVVSRRLALFAVLALAVAASSSAPEQPHTAAAADGPRALSGTPLGSHRVQSQPEGRAGEARGSKCVDRAPATSCGFDSRPGGAPQSTPALITAADGRPYQSGISTASVRGVLSYVSASYGPTYLALPFPRGTVATICAVECVTRRSTDVGPDQRVHPDRIADLSAADWVFVCGLPLSRGTCVGTVELEPPVDPADDRMRVEDGGPVFTLPPTDSTGEQP